MVTCEVVSEIKTFSGGQLLGTNVCLDILHKALIFFLEVGLQDLESSLIYLVIGVHLEGLKLVAASLLFESQCEHVFTIYHEVLSSSFKHIFDSFKCNCQNSGLLYGEHGAESH